MKTTEQKLISSVDQAQLRILIKDAPPDVLRAVASSKSAAPFYDWVQRTYSFAPDASLEQLKKYGGMIANAASVYVEKVGEFRKEYDRSEDKSAGGLLLSYMEALAKGAIPDELAFLRFKVAKDVTSGITAERVRARQYASTE